MEHRKRSKLSGDRISALPEPIIHHILSFLPNKDVKVTSSLSKSWYLLSNSFPSLDFDESWNHMCKSFSFIDYANFHRYLSKYVNYGPKPSEPPQDLLEEYSNYVGESIRRFHEHNNLDILRFSFPFIYLPGVTNPVLLNTWISSVLENHRVEEFSLNIRYPTEKYMTYPFYDLPPSVFASKSIKVADLQVCSLLHSFDPLLASNLRSSSNTNLVKLRLSHVTLDESILSSIICTCPLIEELSIIFCKGIKHLRISNLNNLKTLHISDECHDQVYESVEIEVPSLLSLEMDGVAHVRAFHCPKLTHWVLKCIDVQDCRFQYFLSGMPFLRSLSLTCILSLTKLNISSNTLNKLKIVGCRDLVELKIDAPNLLSAEYKGEFAPLAMSVLNVPGRWHVSTNYHGSENPSKVEDFLVELQDFASASKFKHFECLSVYLCNIHSSSFKELNKGAVLQHAINIDHLNLVLVRPVTRISYLDLLERVLSSCRPHTLSLSLIQDHYPSWSRDDNVVMSICDAIMRQLRCVPCNLARSWVHCVEDLMYVAEDGSEDRLPLGGISVPNLQSAKCAIKFIFKW